MSSLWVPPGIAGHQSDSKHRGILGRLLLNREIKSYGYRDENVEIWGPVASLKSTVHLNACGKGKTIHICGYMEMTDPWRLAFFPMLDCHVGSGLKNPRCHVTTSEL